MDKKMQEILTEEQQPAYVGYRDLLLEKMDERAAAGSRR